MCPPPAEPIRPIGLVTGGTYVDRAQLAERVHGRRPRDEEQEDDEQRRRDRRRRSQEPQAAAPGAVVRDPRAYDDHGRRPDEDVAPDLPHVDATA